VKVVILGNTKLGYSWFVRTFKQGLELNGHDVYEIDYRTTKPPEIFNLVNYIKPRIMFTHLSFHPVYPVPAVLQLYRDIRKKVGTKIIHVLADARHEPRYNKDLKGVIDFAFVSQTENLEKFSNYWKIPTFFCPYSCITQNSIAPINKNLQYRWPVFTGTPNAHPDRKMFLEKLQKKIKLHIFQTQSNEDKRNQTPELSSSAQCILGLCTGYDIKHFIDVRPFQYLGAGAVMIIRKFKNMCDIIPNILYYPFDEYNDEGVDSVVEMFNKYIDDHSDNNKLIRQEAFNFMQKFHSSKIRMLDVVDVIEGKRDNVRSFISDW